MSFGKMNTFISIVKKEKTLDDEGFSKEILRSLHTVRAYRKGRHGSERWANRATFSSATNLFRFRKIPNCTVTTAMSIVCDDTLFEITSVEDVKGRGMYVEVLAKEVIPSG